MANQSERVILDAACRYPIKHLPVIKGIECRGRDAMQQLKARPGGAQDVEGLLRPLGGAHVKAHRGQARAERLAHARRISFTPRVQRAIAIRQGRVVPARFGVSQ